MTNADCRLVRLADSRLGYQTRNSVSQTSASYRYRYICIGIVYIRIGNTIYNLPICSLHMSHTGLFIFFNRFVQIFFESYVALTKQISKEIAGH